MARLVYVYLDRELPRHLAASIAQARSFNAEAPLT